MSNYSSIKATINANIKQNDNQEITGVILNSVLNEMVNTLGAGYLFKGIATSSTNPGSPDEKVVYLAGRGTYTHFGTTKTVTEGNLGVFWWDSSWHFGTVNISTVIDIVNNLTEGGADKALSAEMGKVLNQVISQILALTGYNEFEFVVDPNGAKWREATSGQASKIIYIPAGVVSIILTPSSSVMMWSLFSSVTRPVANGDATTIAAGTDTRYTASSQTEVTNLSDARFICVRADSDPSGAAEPDIQFVYGYRSFIADSLDSLSQKVESLQDQIYMGEALSLGSLVAGYIEANGKWLRYSTNNTTLSAHYLLPVTPGQTYRINAASSMDNIAYFLTSNQASVDGATAPITGSRILTKAGMSSVVSAPSDAAYLYVGAKYVGADMTPASVEQVSAGKSLDSIIPYYDISSPVPIDLSALTARDGAFNKDKTWMKVNGCKHKAMAVSPGEKYVISGDGNGFWAWLTSSYSPTVTSGSAIPYVAGYQRVLQKGAVAVTVPTGAAYLAFVTVNGAGTASVWQIYQVADYARKLTDPIKFHYASWNIGQFIYTDWTPGDPTHTIPADEADEYAQRYKELINGIDADVLGICEYDSSFSAAGQSTKDVIFPCYRHIYEGTKRGASCNTLMFNDLVEYVGKEEILFTTRQEQRYYTHITARLAGENVHLVQAHLDHTYNEKRVAQIAQLISDMAGYKYVIIAGDFNTGDEETVETELAAFTSAGYAMANDGYIGLVITSLTQEYVDNICVRGFSMSKIGTSQESGTLSDHLLIECNLAMDFQE